LLNCAPSAIKVDQLQNFSEQKAVAANQTAVAAASVQNQLQQPAHTKQLLMQRQVAQENMLKRQYNVSPQLGNAGNFWIMLSYVGACL